MASVPLAAHRPSPNVISKVIAPARRLPRFVSLSNSVLLLRCALSIASLYCRSSAARHVLFSPPLRALSLVLSSPLLSQFFLSRSHAHAVSMRGAVAVAARARMTRAVPRSAIDANAAAERRSFVTFLAAVSAAVVTAVVALSALVPVLRFGLFGSRRGGATEAWANGEIPRWMCIGYCAVRCSLRSVAFDVFVNCLA